jgi:RNA polymerase sigma factor (sigma-70 family)
MNENAPTTPAAIDRLVASHREFLQFLIARVGDRAVAEDILQDAFVRGVQHVDELRDGESARAWFYRMLRNAVVDRHRRQSAADRRLAELADALADRASDAALAADRVACACIGELAANLPPDQAQVLRRVELEGAPVKDYAREAGITENAAGVRVHRARKALRAEVERACGSCAEHGCLDCCCKRP